MIGEYIYETTIAYPIIIYFLYFLYMSSITLSKFKINWHLWARPNPGEFIRREFTTCTCQEVSFSEVNNKFDSHQKYALLLKGLRQIQLANVFIALKEASHYIRPGPFKRHITVPRVSIWWSHNTPHQKSFPEKALEAIILLFTVYTSLVFTRQYLIISLYRVSFPARVHAHVRKKYAL